MIKDVTSETQIKMIDDESLWIVCRCGEELWISIYDDMPTECNKCHSKYYFRCAITVYEVTE